MTGIQEKSISIRITYLIRNFLSKPLFSALFGDLGTVLDIGGGSFYKSLNKSTWDNYIVFEPDINYLPISDGSRVYSISGDGMTPPFKNKVFDTVLLIQVLQFILNQMFLSKKLVI